MLHRNSTAGSQTQRRLRLPPQSWPGLIPNDQWAVYHDAIQAVRSTKLPFMLGGGFGLAAYVDHWRDTKDIDFYILPEHHELFARALADTGFADYYAQLPYDRGWIYRSVRGGVIVDLIWSMANRRALVDASWFEHANSIKLREETLQVMPAEELLWCKMYVFQRDHCDWPDVLNLLYAKGPSLDWERLVQRVGPDSEMLKSLLTLFQWVAPGRAAELPPKIRRRFQLPDAADIPPQEEHRRVRLLDSRGWFAPLLSKDAPLEV